MDYLVGFAFGYGLKEIVRFLNNLSPIIMLYYFDAEPLTEDDLP